MAVVDYIPKAEEEDNEENEDELLESEILQLLDSDRPQDCFDRRQQQEQEEENTLKDEERRASKRPREQGEDEEETRPRKQRQATMETGSLSRIPPELFHHILKFLSSEDLISCSLVCWFLNTVASDECLWRRLYCLRWGLGTSAKLRACSWKKLYIQRDREDMIEFIRNTPSEFKEYYIQMQAAKRSQAPMPSQVSDDLVILDKTIAEQVSIWKSSRGFSDEVVVGHVCSGRTCTYSQIGDIFLCERTGRVHVCDDTCREIVLDESTGTLVCTVSGHCFDRWIAPEEEADASDMDAQQVGVTDELEPFMGSGRFARAYLLGYNCDDEKQLEAALRFC